MAIMKRKSVFLYSIQEDNFRSKDFDMPPLSRCIAMLTLVLSLSSLADGDEVRKKELRVEHLGVAHGLSSSSVSKIFQDKYGFMWFATQSGLNRYDGYSFDRYEHDPFDRNSLSHNLIQTMYYEENGVIWLGTYGGLNRFDIKTGNFTWYTHKTDFSQSLSNNVVVAVTRDADGDLWVGTLRGLNRYDAENKRFTRYMSGDVEQGELASDVVRSLAVDNRGTVWIGTYGGLSRYNGNSDSFTTYAPEEGQEKTLPSPYVMCILADPVKENILWTGTWDGGVSRFNTRTKEFTTYTLPHNEIYTMMFDSDGMLWVGTWGNGLYQVDPATGEIFSIEVVDEAPIKKFTTGVIYSLSEDRSGIVWIGTNGTGVYKYVPWENSFQSFVHDPDDETTISDGKIDAAHFDSDGTGWFGTYNGGLNRFDPVTEKFTRYTYGPNAPHSLSNNIVNDIFRDSKGNLWIGTNDGLNRYIPETDSFQRIYAGSDEYTPPEDVVFEITEGPSGALWLGTNTSGVAVYDHTTGRYRVFAHDPDDPSSLSDNLVRSIVHDSHGDTWVGTNDGLNRYDRKTGRFIRYHHDIDRIGVTISSDNIREIYEDTKGRIWIATMGGGVSLYHRETDSFSYLTVEDGLVSNHVLGVLEDKRGKLWFPTNRGISIYDPADKTFRTINESSGLLSNELTKASVQGPTGGFYFGSVKGVCVIRDINRTQSDFIPPVVITTFTVLGEKRELLQTDFHGYEPIELEYTDSYFSFEFAVLDYASPDQNNYFYMLEGFDDEWKQSDRNYISYTNLDPGDYTLKVKGSGSRDNWNEKGTTIPITVNPPWWRMSIAYLGYTVLFVLSLLMVFSRVRRNRLEAEARIAEQESINRELDKKVKERTAEIEQSRALAEEATKAKTLFLANMSHEIRTPLNGLIGMLSLLSKTSLEEKQLEYLDYSRISADTLNTLVNDLLDFERIEAGELKLSNEVFSLRDTVDYIRGLFAYGFREKQLSFTMDMQLGPANEVVAGDRNRIVQILTNLVSNALKYTEKGGVIVRMALFEGAAERSLYLFEVEDTGVGIAEEDLASIFDQFRQLDNGYAKASRGVGLGLAIVKQVTNAMSGSVSVRSTVGKGTTFAVTLPLHPASAGSVIQQSPGLTAESISQPNSDLTETEPKSDEKKAGYGTLLICEDEAINRLYISRYLEGLEYVVDVARDGTEAVEKATKHAYSLILMDLGMPGISGLEAARRIREWERDNRQPPRPIIALTAHSYQEDIQKCREAGMNDFVSKPINESRLRKTIENWIR